MTSNTNPPSSSHALNLLFQQQLQSACGVNSVTAQALLKHQEDQLRATRLLLQQHQLRELMGSPASRSNSLLAQDSIAGLLGLSNAASVAANQAALSALAARRSSVQSVDSTVTEAASAAAAAAEEEAEDNRDDGISDELYFKNFSNNVGNEDHDPSAIGEEDKASSESFPHKLYRMLFEVEQNGQEAIVSFLPSGRGFAIHKPNDFVATIIPRYFTTRRIASFQRQLNLYGFRRISEGKEKGAYFHKDFVKGKRSRVQMIKRKSAASRPSPTSMVHRLPVAAAAPLAFPPVSPSTLFRGSAMISNHSAAPLLSDATKELLLARFAARAPNAAAPTTTVRDSLLEMARKGLMAASSTAGGASHQDILRNAAANLIFSNNNNFSRPF